MLLQLHATSKSFPTSRELGQKGNLQSRPSSNTLMLHRHSSSSLPEFQLSLKNFQSSRTRTPAGHTSSECRGWGMAGVAVSEGCTQTPLLGGLRGRSDTSAPGVGGREAVDGRWEGGREGGSGWGAELVSGSSSQASAPASAALRPAPDPHSAQTPIYDSPPMARV